MSNQLSPVMYSNQRILTTSQVAQFLQTTEKIISQNFNRNKGHYVDGKHYFVLEGQKLKDFAILNLRNANLSMLRTLYLWTEKGVLMHVKSVNTDVAWQAHEHLVDTYFRVQENIQLAHQKDAVQIMDAITLRYSQTLQGSDLYQLFGNPMELNKAIVILESEIISLEENLDFLKTNQRRLYPSKKPQKTHCIHGHAYSEENTYIHPDGCRECRICRAESVRRSRANNKLIS